MKVIITNIDNEKHIALSELVLLLKSNADGFAKGSTERATLLVMIDKINDLRDK